MMELPPADNESPTMPPQLIYPQTDTIHKPYKPFSSAGLAAGPPNFGPAPTIVSSPPPLSALGASVPRKPEKPAGPVYVKNTFLVTDSISGVPNNEEHRSRTESCDAVLESTRQHASSLIPATVEEEAGGADLYEKLLAWQLAGRFREESIDTIYDYSIYPKDDHPTYGTKICSPDERLDQTIVKKSPAVREHENRRVALVDKPLNISVSNPDAEAPITKFPTPEPPPSLTPAPSTPAPEGPPGIPVRAQDLPPSTGFTTIMLRNIPNKYTQQMVLDVVNQDFSGLFDFFYLPIDFRNKCNVGYAFVNFLHSHYAAMFKEQFNGRKLGAFKSNKVCEVSWGRVQGLAANIEHYRNSAVMSIPVAQYKPILFKNGVVVGFPTADGPLPSIKLRPQKC